MSELTKILPAVALRGMTILPGMVVHFDVSRERSMRAIEEAMLQEEKIFLITQKDPDVEVPTGRDLYTTGLVAKIKQVIKLPKNILRILVEGEQRAELIYLEQNDDFLEAEVALYGEEDMKRPSPLEEEAMLRSLRLFLMEMVTTTSSQVLPAIQSVWT